MSKIERSRGIFIGSMGLRAGGGYSGATSELDAAVQQAAEMLAVAYPGFDIEIRFNSDRRSGGAWLKVGDGAAIGIAIGAYAERAQAAALEAQLEADEIDFDTYDTLHCALLRTLHTSAHIGTSHLGNPAVANCDGGRNDPYCHAYMPSMEAAIAFLKLNAKAP